MLKNIFLFILFVLIQVLILSHINIAGIAIPFLYVLFIIRLSTTISSNWVITWGFFLGLTIDLFCNTLGLHALATTVIAFMRQPLLNMFSHREETVSIEPSVYTLGLGTFVKYTLFMVFIHNVLVFGVESFSLFNPLMLILEIVCSTLLTFVLILAVEALTPGKK